MLLTNICFSCLRNHNVLEVGSGVSGRFLRAELSLKLLLADIGLGRFRDDNILQLLQRLTSSILGSKFTSVLFVAANGFRSFRNGDFFQVLSSLARLVLGGKFSFMLLLAHHSFRVVVRLALVLVHGSPGRSFLFLALLFTALLLHGEIQGRDTGEGAILIGFGLVLVPILFGVLQGESRVLLGAFFFRVHDLLWFARLVDWWMLCGAARQESEWMDSFGSAAFCGDFIAARPR